MRRLLAGPAALVLLAGCASGGARPAARRVLVEVNGVRTEADSFAARFLSEAEERGGGVVDARLAGAHLADLADPGSESSRKLREAFPGDSYLAAEVGPCQAFNRTVAMPGSVDPSTGVRTTDIIGGRDISCPVALTESGADGKPVRSLSVEGHVAITGNLDVSSEPSLEAVRDAATQAAKKLFGRKK